MADLLETQIRGFFRIYVCDGLMAIIVQKFGGFSLSDAQSIKGAVAFVSCELARNNKVVVVVSAMYGFTDKLYSYVQELSALEHNSDLRECDVVLTAGEQISAGLFALALKSHGIASQSLLGWQVPIVTNSTYSDAFIESIGTEKIFSLLEKGIVPVITGFQGIEKGGNITSLQRGGSDTSAVAVAVALKAIRCDIYTNVDGVYTADPSLVPDAMQVSSLSYREMLEISLYARVLDNRSVEIAQTNAMPVRVLSSFKKGVQVHTMVGNVLSSSQFFNVVNISCSNKCFAARIFSPDILLLLKWNFPLNLMLLSTEEIFVVCDLMYKSQLVNFINSNTWEFQVFDEIAIVTLVGTRIYTKNASVFSQVVNILEKNHTPIIHAFVSEIRISIMIDYVFADVVVKLLHAFIAKCTENV